MDLLTIILLLTTNLILKIISFIYIYLDAKQKNNEPVLWVLINIYAGFIGISLYILSQLKNECENINKIYCRYLIFYVCFSIISITIITSILLNNIILLKYKNHSIISYGFYILMLKISLQMPYEKLNQDICLNSPTHYHTKKLI